MYPMSNHKIRSTARKTARYVELINLLLYGVRQPLPPFRFRAGNDSFVAVDVDDRHWPVITPDRQWNLTMNALTAKPGGHGISSETCLSRACLPPSKI